MEPSPLQPDILWKKCLDRLQQEMATETEAFNMWIRPLQLAFEKDQLCLFAPNRYVSEHIKEKFLACISRCLMDLHPEGASSLQLKVGSPWIGSSSVSIEDTHTPETPPALSTTQTPPPDEKADLFQDTRANQPNALFSFENFVEGKSNQLARAAALQVGAYPGVAYNPLFIYGGVGLGKTHLMHAVGNLMREKKTGCTCVVFAF